MEDQKKIKETAFKGFATKRIMVGILLTMAGLWIFVTVIGLFDPSPTKHGATARKETQVTTGDHGRTALPPSSAQNPASGPATSTHGTPAPAAHATAQKAYARMEQKAAAPARGAATHTAPSATDQAPPAHPAPAQSTATHAAPPATGHGTTQTYATTATLRPKPRGVAFVAAAIKPMEYELKERFYGWRPNDILDFTDNVNSYQLGVLEVTRRTAVNLTERISRTGSTDSFDPNLENAMNWFMIKSTRYWFPSPESKYEAGLDELRKYMEKLSKGQAAFHTRPDNLIPLLMAYEDLLGSCDENLVKMQEDDGSPVSFFKADDYFFYAKGIASAMLTILEAIGEDFHTTVETRRGVDLLHHAIESLHHATQIDPWLITNAALSGILANHRANMAAPISHARFYIGALIKTLST